MCPDLFEESSSQPAQEMDSFTPRPEDGSQQQQIHDLMCYLWDNYLQLYEAAEEIFLMGVGNANLGIKLLLINRGRSRRDK
jgi:histone deacetylase 6